MAAPAAAALPASYRRWEAAVLNGPDALKLSERPLAPPAAGEVFRIGGLVETGSLVRGQGETVTFSVTDTNQTVPVRFTGVLPDLFAEGAGMVGTGSMEGNTFVATEILAKHDENYKPPQMAGREHKTETLSQ